MCHMVANISSVSKEAIQEDRANPPIGRSFDLNQLSFGRP